ncbi:MAG: LuxR C-terminal-related transcriptional regulator [Streptosporangiaceae bacterium]
MSKITVPALRGWVVPRPRVGKLIADGARGPLTTVTGPPGAGKTMATALWAANASPGTTVWITLDRYDNRPKVFWSYVVAALRRAGIAVPRTLSVPTRGAVDHGFLLRLASVLAAQDAPVWLVLDDIHLITEPAILDALDYVLRNATPWLHLVVSSRMDPLLPLHRYRLTGELTEIRADDLAFSVPEASLLLAHHGITLSAAALECLTGRTEGWAAGVRMAALSLDGHPDPEQFVKELDADDNAVSGYLVGEVLDAQLPATRELLLRTSILDCVSAGLASELTGDPQAVDALTALAQANAFVRPLGHGWFRYHAMFAEVLRLKLRSEHPNGWPDLHQRAARWYQRNGFLIEAVRHGAACDDWPLAAGMVIDALAIGQLVDPRGSQSLAEVFRDMPADLARTHPYPLLASAAMSLSDAAGPPCAALLAAAESLLDELPADGEIPARLSAALIRLALSQRTGDLDIATAAAASAMAMLEALPEGTVARHPGIRTQVLASRGAAELRAGRLDEAVATFKEGAAFAADSACERGDCLAYLALVEALGGRLSRAVELAEAAAQTSQDRSDGLTEQVAPAASIALASVHLDRNEIPQAHRQLRLAEAALRVRPDKLVSAVACLIAARCRLAEGRAPAALETIGRARQGWSAPDWLEYRLTLLESRAHAAMGDIQAAVAAARRGHPASGPDVAAALARAWLAAGDHQAARQALDTGTEGAAAEPEHVRLEGWLVDARVRYLTGDVTRGRQSLERALRLGRSERLRLPFTLERTWIQPVLQRDPDLARAYRELLEPDLVSPAGAGVPAPRQAGAGPAAPLIIEPLTEREHEALQYLSEMLSTAEIASEMYISVNTVKSHLRSIYRKLSAAHRNEAVRRARQLELIT